MALRFKFPNGLAVASVGVTPTDTLPPVVAVAKANKLQIAERFETATAKEVADRIARKKEKLPQDGFNVQDDLKIIRGQAERRCDETDSHSTLRAVAISRRRRERAALYVVTPDGYVNGHDVEPTVVEGAKQQENGHDKEVIEISILAEANGYDDEKPAIEKILPSEFDEWETKMSAKARVKLPKARVGKPRAPLTAAELEKRQAVCPPRPTARNQIKAALANGSRLTIRL